MYMLDILINDLTQKLCGGNRQLQLYNLLVPFSHENAGPVGSILRSSLQPVFFFRELGFFVSLLGTGAFLIGPR
jgi:hypothetical protein